MKHLKGTLMNDRRALSQMAAPGNSAPNIPSRTFLLRAHLLRILWGSALVVGFAWYWAVYLINAPTYPCGTTRDYSTVLEHLGPLTLFTIPYIIHIALQVRAYMQCRKEVNLHRVRWINIYSILAAPMMSVMLFAVVLPINREPSPVLYDTLMSLIFLGEIVFSAIMIIAVSKALKHQS